MPPNGHTACAIVIPGGIVSGFEDDGIHHLILAPAKPGKSFVHYLGAGWSKSGDFPDQASWETAVDQLSRRLKAPLVVEAR